MKKKLLALLLGVCFAFSCFGCGNDMSNNKNSLYRVWQALEDNVKHDIYASEDPNRPGVSTGGYPSGKYWETNWIYTRQKSTVSCEVDDIAVKQGYYNFATTVSVNNIVSSFYGQNYDIIAEMRVQDSATGENLAYRTVNRYEFKKADVLQSLSLPFYVTKDTKVDIFFCVVGSGGNLHRVDELSLRAISKEEYLVPDYEYFLSSKGEEIVYDDNAIYYFDLYKYLAPLSDSRAAYDIASMAFALQGLANRNGQKLFINYQAVTYTNHSGFVDQFWLKELTKPGSELEGKEIVKVKQFETLLKLFDSSCDGLVVWDEKVPATYNAACTAAGVENLLPVRYDAKPESLYNILKYKFNMSEKLNLHGKFNGKGTVWGTKTKTTTSAKNDVYIWAMETYLKTGRTNPTLMANMLDAASWDFTWKEGEQVVTYYDLQQCFLPNKDYYIQNKAFFFDLGFYDTYAPGDDLNQPLGTDLNTLKKILEVQNDMAGSEIIDIGGFVAWYFPKYTDAVALHPTFPGAVDVEWRASEIFGWYNAVTAADAYGTEGAGVFTNASFYSQIPQLAEYKQTGDCKQWYNADTKALENVKTTLENVNYVCVYMGDYDSAAWTNAYMIETYMLDNSRGKLPLAWPVVTGNVARVPHVFNRLYTKATVNDYFVGGDNGYAYNDPGSLIAPDRPTKSNGQPLNGNLETYEAKLMSEWEKFDIDVMGFLISTKGGSDSVDNIFAKYANGGVFTNYTRVYADNPGLIDYLGTPANLDDDVPTLELKTISDQTTSPDQAAANINAVLGIPSEPTFTGLRSIIDKPSTIYQAVNIASASGKKIRVVDPYTFNRLYKEYTISKILGR